MIDKDTMERLIAGGSRSSRLHAQGPWVHLSLKRHSELVRPLARHLIELARFLICPRLAGGLLWRSFGATEAETS